MPVRGSLEGWGGELLSECLPAGNAQKRPPPRSPNRLPSHPPPTSPVAAARLLYECAAVAGSAAGATALGRTYDPDVLVGLRARGSAGVRIGSSVVRAERGRGGKPRRRHSRPPGNAAGWNAWKRFSSSSAPASWRAP